MPDFNPNSTNIAGLEWFPTRNLPRALKVGAGIGVTLASTATETPDSLQVWLESAANCIVGVDIYDASSVWAAGDVLGGGDTPVIDFSSTAGWQQSTDGGNTFTAYDGTTAFTDLAKVIPDTYTAIDILTLVAGTGLVMRYLPAGSQQQGHLMFQSGGSYFKITDGTSGNDPSSNRVGWIEVDVTAKAINGASPTIDGWLNVAGNNYGSDDGPSQITPHWARYTYRFFFNPATGTQWYNSDIAQFLSGGTNAFGLNIRGSAGTDFQVAAVNIVFRSLPERRVASGYTTALAGNGYRTATLVDPTDGTTAAWSKSASTDYLFLFYLTTGGAAALSGCDQASLAENPTGQLSGFVGTDQTTYTNTPVPNGPVTQSSWAPTLVLVASFVASVDSMSYLAPFVWRVASSDGVDGEVLAAHATASYGMVSAVIGMFDAAGNAIFPDAPLEIGIYDTSNALQGGTFEVDPGDVPADGRFHLVQGHLSSSASLSSGTAYYIGFTTTSSVPWSVCYNTTSFTFGNGTLLGTAGGGATFNGATDLTSDILANALTVPPPLTSLTVAIDNFVPTGGLLTVYYAELTWDASSLGGDFGYYEVQRSADSGTTWYTIATVGTEVEAGFDDVEAPRNVESQWRVRVVRSDGAASDWA